jgi:O-antigen/teichoic acid export membrane protein
MTLFIQAYRMAAEPFFFNESKNSNAKETYSKTMNAFIVVCAFIFAGIMLNIDFLKFFIDKKFHEGLFIVPVLLLANMCLGIYYNLSIWYKLSNKTLSGAWIALFGAAVTLILNIWWIPYYGYAGSAWATLVCYASMMIVSYFTGSIYYPIPYNVFKIITYIAAMLAVYMAHHYLFSGWYDKSRLLLFIINSFLLSCFAAIVYIAEFRKKGKQVV